MATVDNVKAQKILMYLWANGFKYTNMAEGAGVGLGADVIQFLESQGHTVQIKAKDYLLCDNDKKYSPRGTGIAGSTYSELIGSKWHENSPSYMALVSETFGLNRDEVDTLYSNGVLRLGVPVPPRKGGAGRSQKYGKFNRDGWGAININSIAETGSVDSNWTKSVKDNAAGTSTMQTVPNPKYKLGTELGTYGAAIPTVSPSGVAPAAGTTPPPPPAGSSEEEEEEEVPAEEPEEVPPGAFDEYLDTDDLSAWWKNGEEVEEIDTESGREISSKAWTSASGKIEVPLSSAVRVQVGMGKREDENLWSINFLQMLVTVGAIDGKDMAKYNDAASNTESLLDEDKEEYEDVALPKVSFVFVDGQTYIEIEGFGLVEATKGLDFYNYKSLKLVMNAPNASTDPGKITDILVNKQSFADTLTLNGGVYGFPYNGIDGIENRFKADNYTDEGAGNTAEQQAQRALSSAYIEGYRNITFYPVIQSIEFDKSTLPDDVLQPLALNFDKEIDLSNQGVYFALNYATTKDASNLFPGFNINDSSDSNQQDFMFPYDIRNLRPINEDGVVMNPKDRELGEGITSIEVDSTNGVVIKDALTVGSKTYDATVYSQIKLTTDKETILIPDSDERFKAMDNQDTEINGTINAIEGRPALMVITGKLDVADIEKYLKASRRSSRLSSKYNSIDPLTSQVDTKTIMVQQQNDYVIIVGIGPKTYALKIKGD